MCNKYSMDEEGNVAVPVGARWSRGCGVGPGSGVTGEQGSNCAMWGAAVKKFSSMRR